MITPQEFKKYVAGLTPGEAQATLDSIYNLEDEHRRWMKKWEDLGFDAHWMDSSNYVYHLKGRAAEVS